MAKVGDIVNGVESEGDVGITAQTTTTTQDLINYPDLRMDDWKYTSVFPKKEVQGSGLDLAKQLYIYFPDDNQQLPLKYGQKPQVGDVPVGFPSSLDEFTPEDVFWLVVFYNDSFALEFRDRYLDGEILGSRASEDLFTFWWHLDCVARNEGRMPACMAVFDGLKLTLGSDLPEDLGGFPVQGLNLSSWSTGMDVEKHEVEVEKPKPPS